MRLIDICVVSLQVCLFFLLALCCFNVAIKHPGKNCIPLYSRWSLENKVYKVQVYKNCGLVSVNVLDEMEFIMVCSLIKFQRTSSFLVRIKLFPSFKFSPSFKTGEVDTNKLSSSRQTPQSFVLSWSLRVRMRTVAREATDMWKRSCHAFLRPSRYRLHKTITLSRTNDFTLF